MTRCAIITQLCMPDPMKLSFDEAVQAMARINPGGRLIEPVEVAAAAVKLLWDEGTNGETIILDGS